MNRKLLLSTIVFFFLLLRPTISAGQNTRIAADFLDSIRLKYKLPAIGCAIIAQDTLAFLGVAGVRKLSDTVKETPDDAWHLGSDTKAFTAAMIGKLVEEKLLSYSSTIGEIFPELNGTIQPAYARVTLDQLLEHRAGLWHDWPDTFSRSDFDTLTGSLREIRLKFLRILLMQPPEYTPGSKYSYSNTGYVIAAAMAERAANEPYEALMERLVFRPLGIVSAGWGPMNTPGHTDNTWEHREDASQGLIPVDNIDNPVIDNPAGRLHVTLRDWSLFIRTFMSLSKSRITNNPLSRLESFRTQSKEGECYQDGWTIVSRKWANGVALNHAGSNRFNFANVWIAPNRDFAVMVTINAGNANAQAASEEVIGRAMEAYLH